MAQVIGFGVGMCDVYGFIYQGSYRVYPSLIWAVYGGHESMANIILRIWIPEN